VKGGASKATPLAHWLDETPIRDARPRPLEQARLRRAAGALEGRGGDALTDEIAKRKRRRAHLPHTKIMFPKGKGTPVPSDGQAREK